MTTGWHLASLQTSVALLLLTLGLVAAPVPAWGQEAGGQDAAAAQGAATADDAPTGASKRGTSLTFDDIVELLRASGPIGAVIALLSMAAFALVIEHLFTIRRGVLMPRPIANELHTHISNGEFAQAEQVCKLRPSYLAYVVLAGLQEVRVGYQAVEKAMEDASQEQAARLFRKVEYLALIGNITPMLGLLGTVYGLLLAFKRVAETQGGATAGELADGIYLALISTVMGLVVAIPTLGCYAIFRSRVEQLAAETGLLAEQVFANYKRDQAVLRR